MLKVFFEVLGSGHLDVIELACRHTVLQLLVDSEVRHLLVGQIQQIAIILMVVGIGEVEVGGYLDALREHVVESDTCGEAVELLLDDGTGLMVPTEGETEVGLLATT